VTYTAPAAAGSHTVTATSAADTGKRASATVNVTLPEVQVALNPSGTVSIAASASRSFTASVTGTGNTAVAWTVDGQSGGSSSAGTITGSGNTVVYTAPAAAGTHTVKATSAADAGKSASATVRVQAAGAVKVALASVGPANIIASGATLLTATVSNSSDTAVTWTVDGVPGGNADTGTILAPVSGNRVVYLAPAAVGAHLITATSRADASASASLTLTATASASLASSIPVGANVRDTAYGAAGDGATDDTAAINKAVRAVAGTGRAVRVPAGTYLINATANSGAGIVLGSDMALVLEPGATFRALPSSTMHYQLVKASGASNLVISGGTYIGNNDDNSIPTPTTTEDGNAIEILGCANVVIENVVAEKCFCDGIYIAEGSQDVVVCNATATANRRHGMAIVNATGVVVLGSTFSANTGSVEESGGPVVNGCGIDVEANADEHISDVLVYGCTFAGNTFAGLGWGVGLGTASGSSTNGVFVIGNTATGNSHGLDVENCPDSAIVGNIVDGNSRFGILIHDGATGTVCTGNTVRNTGAGGDGAGIECYLDENSLVDSNLSTGNPEYGILVVQSTGATVTNNRVPGNGTAGVYVYRSTGVVQSGNTTQ
jgi:parallel beta-helix repeat protein